MDTKMLLSESGLLPQLPLVVSVKQSSSMASLTACIVDMIRQFMASMENGKS